MSRFLAAVPVTMVAVTMVAVKPAVGWATVTADRPVGSRCTCAAATHAAIPTAAPVANPRQGIAASSRGTVLLPSDPLPDRG